MDSSDPLTMTDWRGRRVELTAIGGGCRAYEVTALKDGGITQCPVDLPGEPMELNAY